MTDASPEARTQAGRDLLDGMDWQMTTGEELQTAILVIEAEAIKPYRELVHRAAEIGFTYGALGRDFEYVYKNVEDELAKVEGETTP